MSPEVHRRFWSCVAIAVVLAVFAAVVWAMAVTAPGPLRVAVEMLAVAVSVLSVLGFVAAIGVLAVARIMRELEPPREVELPRRRPI